VPAEQDQACNARAEQQSMPGSGMKWIVRNPNSAIFRLLPFWRFVTTCIGVIA
jgi:hypothetical protein